jgi:hypothetical protein
VKLPPAALARLQLAHQGAESMRLEYQALTAMAIEALGFDLSTQVVHLDIQTGVVEVVKAEEVEQ